MRDTIKETNELRRGAANFQLRSTLQKGKPIGIGSVKLIEQWVFDTGTVLFQRIILALGIYSNQYRFERDEILSAWSRLLLDYGP